MKITPITKFLLKTFIKDYEQKNNLDIRTKYGILEGWTSIIINTTLAIIKFIAGYLINSISLTADAVHTFSDSISSIAVIWGFKASSAPPDEKHPFGHGRLEYITTLFIAILLVVTGVEFLKATFQRVMNPEPVAFNLPVIVIFTFTILVKEWLARFSRELGILIDSKALIGDYHHHRSDVITSLMVLVPLFSEKINFIYLDGLIGVMVSGYIFYTGWKMAYDGISPLIGEAPTFEELHKIKTIAMSVNKVKGVHDIVLHKYGQIKIISLHVEIPENTPFIEGHEIIEDVEKMINQKMSATTVIHIDPLQKMTDELSEVHNIMKDLIEENTKLDSYHDVRVVKLKGDTTLILDVVATQNATPLQLKALHHQVTSCLNSNFPEHIIKVWIEPKFHMFV